MIRILLLEAERLGKIVKSANRAKDSGSHAGACVRQEHTEQA